MTDSWEETNVVAIMRMKYLVAENELLDEMNKELERKNMGLTTRVDRLMDTIKKLRLMCTHPPEYASHWGAWCSLCCTAAPKPG